MTRSQYEQFCLGLQHLALDIGLRAASRALGISESKGLKIAYRQKWNMAKLSPAISAHQRCNREALESGGISVDIKRALLAAQSDRTKLALGAAAVSASEHLATLEPRALMNPHSGIAADTWSRTADRVHGWSAERSKPLVQIATVTLPSDEEVLERRRAHDALDEIARALKLRD